MHAQVAEPFCKGFATPKVPNVMLYYLWIKHVWIVSRADPGIFFLAGVLFTEHCRSPGAQPQSKGWAGPRACGVCFVAGLCTVTVLLTAASSVVPMVVQLLQRLPVL